MISLNETISEIHAITLNDEDWYKLPYTNGNIYHITLKADFKVELFSGESVSVDYIESQNNMVCNQIIKDAYDCIFEPNTNGELSLKVQHKTYYYESDFEEMKSSLSGYYSISIDSESATEN